MHETKLVVGLASACGTLAILACVFVIPSLYGLINEMHDEVVDGIQVEFFEISFFLKNVTAKKFYQIFLLFKNFTALSAVLSNFATSS